MWPIFREVIAYYPVKFIREFILTLIAGSGIVVSGLITWVVFILVTFCSSFETAVGNLEARFWSKSSK